MEATNKGSIEDIIVGLERQEGDVFSFHTSVITKSPQPKYRDYQYLPRYRRRHKPWADIWTLISEANTNFVLRCSYIFMLIFIFTYLWNKYQTKCIFFARMQPPQSTWQDLFTFVLLKLVWSVIIDDDERGESKQVFVYRRISVK